MKQLFLILIVLFFQSAVYGQKNNRLESNLFLKISPLFLVDLYGSSCCIISIESKNNNNISISADLGIFYPFNITGFKNNRGWRAGFELRRYFKKDEGQYFAVNYGYKNHQYEFNDSINIKGIPTYTKYHTYSKEVHVLNIMYGFQRTYGNSRFFFNDYFGLGIRFKNTESTGLTQEEQDNIDYLDSQILPVTNQITKRFLLNFVAGVKIGYIIR